MSSYPLLQAGYHLIKPRTREEVRSVLEYLKRLKKNSDVIYIYYGARAAFEYYSQKYGFNENSYIKGIASRNNLGGYIDDINKLCGTKRVWIVFSHIYRRGGVDEEKFYLFYLDRIGKRLDCFRSVGASIYLYDLSQCTIIKT